MAVHAQIVHVPDGFSREKEGFWTGSGDGLKVFQGAVGEDWAGRATAKKANRRPKMTPQETKLFTELSIIAEQRHRLARRAQSDQLRHFASATGRFLSRCVQWATAILRRSVKVVG